MGDIIKEYSDYLCSRGIADNSVISYKRDLKQFAEWLNSSGKSDPKAVGAYDIESYINGLRENGFSAATISRRTTSLRLFFSWAREEGIILIDPMSGISSPKVIRKSPTVINESEIAKLIESCADASPKDIRDRAMLILLASTGISVSEMLKAGIDDVNLQEKTLKLTGRKRSALLNKRSLQALKRYISEARPLLIKKGSLCDVLFLSANGRRLSRQGFCKNFNRIVKNAGLSADLTPAVLRHSYAVHALKSGDDPKDVQERLGLATSSSVSEYSRIAGKL